LATDGAFHPSALPSSLTSPNVITDTVTAAEVVAGLELLTGKEHSEDAELDKGSHFS